MPQNSNRAISSTVATTLALFFLLSGVSLQQSQQRFQPLQRVQAQRLQATQLLTNTTSCIGRRVYNATAGKITDGVGKYPDSAHCEWLIVGGRGQFIMLEFVSMETECLYDFLFIYDGDSYTGQLLGSFSGRSLPDIVVAKSGNMLIHFFTDRNFNLTGFYAHYSISPCVRNCSTHGVCDRLSHTCICAPGYTGEGCEHTGCSNACSAHGTCDTSTYTCHCDAGYIGHDCTLLVNRSAAGANDEPSRSGWYNLLPYSTTFLERAGHAGAWVSEMKCLYIFGGNTLNTLLNDLVFYCINGNGGVTDWQAVTQSSDSGPWPAARHGHTLVSGLHTRLFLFGGELEGDVHSKELWMFDIDSNRWTRLAEHSNMHPPGVTGHSMTLVDDHWIYILGGRTESSGLIADMYRIDITSLDTIDKNNDTGTDHDDDISGRLQWENVWERGGKKSDRRLVGHSAVYHPSSRSILVFGGFVPDNARFPMRTNSLYAYHVVHNWWSELHNDSRPAHAPRERAFHQAVLLGDYLVIHGGNIHRHEEEERCFDEKLYFYHLACHVWVDHIDMARAVSYGEKDKEESMKGRYGHVTVAAFGNLLLVAGGYRGSVLNDLVAFNAPINIARPQDDVTDTSYSCSIYSSADQCYLDPECTWCTLFSSSEQLCLARINSSLCKRDTRTNCPGICGLLRTCDACTVMGDGGEMAKKDTDVKLRVPMVNDKCAWCVKQRTCQRLNEPSGVCNHSRSTMSGLEGWWNGTSKLLTSLDQCTLMDQPDGLHLLKFRHPANFNLPDEVEIVRITSVSFTFSPEFDRERNSDTEYVCVMKGFIHPLSVLVDKPPIKLHLVGSAAHAKLYMSTDSQVSKKEKVAELVLMTFGSQVAKRENGSEIFPRESRGYKYYVEHQASQAVAAIKTTQVTSTMQLEWNGSLKESTRLRNVITAEFLEPYNGPALNCSTYLTCLACMTDTSCGWCEKTCIARVDAAETDVNKCHVSNGSSTLILNSLYCPTCSDFVDCLTCLQEPYCEWLIPDARCVRLGRFPGAVSSVSAPDRLPSSIVQQCPISCLERTNSSWCLSDKNECAWCQQKGECFPFVEYSMRYEYGACSDWVDSVTVDQAQNCSMHTVCGSCLAEYMCGWCGNRDNPSIGVCHRGEFTGPMSTLNCSTLISSQFSGGGVAEEMLVAVDNDSMSDWSYTMCPDVDECRLKIDRCHSNAVCVNTYGSYYCVCHRGFTGDGLDICSRSCYETCVHGRCSGAPDYQCICDLGWTGADCGTNCGCNNHSTCQVTVGQCDKCQQNTMGAQCDQCMPGSFGSPQSTAGCQTCQCNGHGDIARGVCNNITGVCYCTDNTIGDQCTSCVDGHYGNPRLGGWCYRNCDGRLFLYNVTAGALGSHCGMAVDKRQHAYCVWILTVYPELLPLSAGPPVSAAHRAHTAIISLTIESDIKLTCNKDYVYIYDGIFPYPGFSAVNDVNSPRFSHDSGETSFHRPATLLASFCGQNSTSAMTVQARSGYMTVFFEAYNKNGFGSYGFNASYSTLHACTTHHRETLNSNDVGSSPSRGEGSCETDDHVMCERDEECVEEEEEEDLRCPLNCSASLGHGVCQQADGRCVCEEGYGGIGCAIPLARSLFYAPVYESVVRDFSLVRTGHSLVACYDGAIYMFGGYTPGRGVLNDLWKFDPVKDEWTQLRVLTSEEPEPRYFHAAVCIPHLHTMIVFGGLLRNISPTRELWSYSLDSGRWNKVLSDKSNIQIEESGTLPQPMAGHSMTLIDDVKVYIIEGFSHSSYFTETVYVYDAGLRSWHLLADIQGSRPIGLYGHSAVYHSLSQSVYVHGGYTYVAGKGAVLSNSLYALDLAHRNTNPSNLTWSILPSGMTNSKPIERYLHGALSTDQYMAVWGGYSSDHSPISVVSVYHYTCNKWLNVTTASDVGRDHLMLVGPAVQLSTTGDIYLMPSISSQLRHFAQPASSRSQSPHTRSSRSWTLVRVTLPADICQLQRSDADCVNMTGCTACTVQNTLDMYCYSTAGPRPHGCLVENTSVAILQGVQCDSKLLERRSCDQYKTCSDCLAKWPVFPTSGRTCQWCSNCPIGRCIPLDADCQKVNPCNIQQHKIIAVKDCLDRQCLASDCDACHRLQPRCAWSRNVKNHGETMKAVSLRPMFDWSCSPSNIIDITSNATTDTSPPAQCPLRCYEFTTCVNCLAAISGEGGAHSCFWSAALHQCLPPAYLPLACADGLCGLLLEGHHSECPVDCTLHTRCSSCLQVPRCGWCAASGVPHGGRGVCVEGGLGGPSNEECNLTLFAKRLDGVDWMRDLSDPPTWSFAECPLEDECSNGHSDCNPRNEQCINLPNGYKCQCKPGYSFHASREMCEPVCERGCVHGTCTEPNVCTCQFGYIGHNCSMECKCNKHSNCKSDRETQTCLECRNNTMGAPCDRCKPLYVGRALNGGSCISCTDLCNQHSRVCMSREERLRTIEMPGLPLDVDNVTQWLRSGPSEPSNTVCISCGNNTQSHHCSECRNGFFRLKGRPLFEPCIRCNCSGHSDICDKDKGENCDCKNNTKSPLCESTDPRPCYEQQCTTCIDNFFGTPTNGHQCYRQMTVEREQCFDPTTQMNCNPTREPMPLNNNRTVFFAVQPKYLNVDIRVILDVTKGGLDLYFSPFDNTYQVSVNPLTGIHRVLIDPSFKYERVTSYNSDDVSSNRQRRHTMFRRPRRAASTRIQTSCNITATTKDIVDSILKGSPVPPCMPKNQTLGLENIDKVYRLEEEWSGPGPVTFITVSNPDTFLIVRNVTNRLVIMLPHDIHHLKVARFYLVLVGAGSLLSNQTYGIVYFRQDQPHIDLFVFFSVFFSCFFLFLAVCVLLWKMKQVLDMQRSRIQRRIEMQTMASRPFSRSLIYSDTTYGPYCIAQPLIPQNGTDSLQKNNAGGRGGGGGGGGGIPRISSRYTLSSNTASSGGNRRSSSGGCGNGVTDNTWGDGVPFSINPLAMEPTADSLAVVATFLFQLPGDASVPVKACLGTALVSARILYPNAHHNSTPTKPNSVRSRGGAHSVLVNCPFTCLLP